LLALSAQGGEPCPLTKLSVSEKQGLALSFKY